MLKYSNRIFGAENMIYGENVLCEMPSLSMLPAFQCSYSLLDSDGCVLVMEPNGDLARGVHAFAEENGRKSVLFAPASDKSVKFNPMSGNEMDVIDTITSAFQMMNPDMPSSFHSLNCQLLGNAIKVLKRLDAAEKVDGKYATLINLNRLLQNSGGQGRDMVNQFARIPSSIGSEAIENAYIAAWFLNDYFAEHSKVFDATIVIRTQISNLVSHELLRDALNPDFKKGEKNGLDFNAFLAEDAVVCISTEQSWIRGFSSCVGCLVTLTLQRCLLRRIASKNESHPCILLFRDCQKYMPPDFNPMLSQISALNAYSLVSRQDHIWNRNPI